MRPPGLKPALIRGDLRGPEGAALPRRGTHSCFSRASGTRPLPVRAGVQSLPRLESDPVPRAEAGRSPATTAVLSTLQLRRTTWDRATLRPRALRQFLPLTSARVRSRVSPSLRRGCGVCWRIPGQSIRRLPTDDGMSIRRHVGRRSFSGSDGPDGLVRNDQFRGFLGRDFVESAQALAAKNVIREAGFALFEHFADADDRDSPASRPILSLRFTVSSVSPKYWRRSEWPMITWVTPTAVSMLAADFAGIGAFLLPVQILRADGDVGPLGGVDGDIDASSSGRRRFRRGRVRQPGGENRGKSRGPGQAFCTSSSWRR